MASCAFHFIDLSCSRENSYHSNFFDASTKAPFITQKSWVRTCQERSTDLTFLHFFEMGTGPCFFGGIRGHRRLWPQQSGKTWVWTSFFFLTSASVIISLIACAYRPPILEIGSGPKRSFLCPSRSKLLSV